MGIRSTDYKAQCAYRSNFSLLSYGTAERPGEIDLYAICLDDHRSLTHTKHLLWQEHMLWVELGDKLPREG